jgi:glycosyl transferase, family 25
MKVFLINLDRSPDRLAYMSAQADACGMTLERVPAVDGRTMAQPFLGNTFAEHLSMGERGCYASHLRCCQLIVELGLPYAMILEDDAILTPLTLPLAEQASARAPKKWDFIHLSGLTRHATAPMATLDKDHKLVWYSRRPPFNAAAYIMSAAGAAKFLEPQHRTVPNDSDVRRQGVFKLNVYGVEPRIVDQAWSFTSVAEHDTAGLPRHRAIERESRLKDWVWRTRQVGPITATACTLQNVLAHVTQTDKLRRQRKAFEDERLLKANALPTATD